MAEVVPGVTKRCAGCHEVLPLDDFYKGLGHFKDNPLALRAAAAYLEKHNG